MKTTTSSAIVTLHGFAGSTYTRTARMVCVEKRLPHQLAALDFRADSHRALHPFLKMPVLEHAGHRLFETLAIASYLDGIGDGPALQPAPGPAHAVMLQWISVALHYLYPDLVTALLDTVPTAGDARVAADLDLLERRLAEAAFLAGPTLSLADLFVAPMLAFAIDKTGADLAPRRGLARWWRAVSERPSFVETAA